MNSRKDVFLSMTELENIYSVYIERAWLASHHRDELAGKLQAGSPCSAVVDYDGRKCTKPVSKPRVKCGRQPVKTASAHNKPICHGTDLT